MKNRLLIALNLLGLLLMAGCATPWDKTQTPSKTPIVTQRPTPQLEIRDKITATAMVQAVDLENRQVVLKGKGGRLHTIAVGDEVRNLPQVKVGDRVELTYYEALAVTLDKNTTGGIPSRKETISVQRAAPGQKPAGEIREDIEIVANVVAIKQKTRKVTLEGAQGAVTLKVPKDIDISKLKVGDQVKANYVQGLAVAVRPVSGKSAKPARTK